MLTTFNPRWNHAGTVLPLITPSSTTCGCRIHRETVHDRSNCCTAVSHPTFFCATSNANQFSCHLDATPSPCDPTLAPTTAPTVSRLPRLNRDGSSATQTTGERSAAFGSHTATNHLSRCVDANPYVYRTVLTHHGTAHNHIHNRRRASLSSQHHCHGNEGTFDQPRLDNPHPHHRQQVPRPMTSPSRPLMTSSAQRTTPMTPASF